MSEASKDYGSLLFAEPGVPEPEDALSAVKRLDSSGQLTLVSRELDAALSGDADAAREYVAGYSDLIDVFLEAASTALPEILCEHTKQPTNATPQWYVVLGDLLKTSPVAAGFSTWRNEYDSDEALALHITMQVREVMGLATLQAPPGPPPVENDLDAQRFLRRVVYHVGHPSDADPLERIRQAFGVSKTELGRLFGVSRQAIDGWQQEGVPSERQEKLTALLALIDLLERKLKPDRLPGVARRTAEAYGDQTMLDLIAADRHDELLEIVRGSFDWSLSA